jgi:hypothetical protein
MSARQQITAASKLKLKSTRKPQPRIQKQPRTTKETATTTTLRQRQLYASSTCGKTSSHALAAMWGVSRKVALQRIPDSTEARRMSLLAFAIWNF